MEYAISLKNLTKFYKTKNGQITALDNVDLDIPKGSIFALLGPNGAGKSTLINILAGLVVKSSGNAEIMGYDITKNPQLARKQIGIVPQELVIDTFFPLYEALELFAGYYGIRPKNRKTTEILKALGLWNKRFDKPKQLSGGMRRRFLVAKAMVHSPPVLVLDEPTAGVDIDLREQLWDYVLKLNKEGTTIILTTHYLEEAERLSDYIAFIDNGKIIASKPKSAIITELGKKEINIEFAENISQIPKSLASFEAELINNNHLKITYNVANNPISEIMANIKLENLTVTDITTDQADLEDIFRNVINEKKLA